MTAAHRPVLISAADLHQRLAQAAPPIVLDARFWLTQPAQGAAAHLEGHIPGAHHADLDRDLSGPRTGKNGRHPLPDRATLAQTLARWGITPSSHVVVYDEQQGAMAARAWWLLGWMGVAHVQVLDGGLPAWRDRGGDLQTGPTPSAPAAAASQWPAPAWPTRSSDQILAGLGQQRLIDARGPDRYRGENETLDPHAGHIPGALNRFFGLNVGVDGRFLSPAMLREQWAALGVDETSAAHTVHQCGSGVTACHNLLALAHAGLPMGVLYPGSWSEWCSDEQRPRATGEAPGQVCA